MLRIVLALTGKEEHLALFDANVSELIFIDHAEEHAALVLVEPLLHVKYKSGHVKTFSACA